MGKGNYCLEDPRDSIRDSTVARQVRVRNRGRIERRDGECTPCQPLRGAFGGGYASEERGFAGVGEALYAARDRRRGRAG